MQHNKSRKYKYTRRYRKTVKKNGRSKKNKHANTRTIQRETSIGGRVLSVDKLSYNNNNKSNRRHIYRFIGGLNKTNTDIIDSFKKIIEDFIATEEAKISAGTPTLPKYDRYKTKIDEYKTVIKDKPHADLLTKDLATIQELFLIITDDTYNMTYSDIFIKNVQDIIQKIIMVFLDESELSDTTDFTFKKRITNNMPYLDVIHKRTGYETTYDVNEMLHLLKLEMDESSYKDAFKNSILKKLKLETKFNVQPTS